MMAMLIDLIREITLIGRVEGKGLLAKTPVERESPREGKETEGKSLKRPRKRKKSVKPEKVRQPLRGLKNGLLIAWKTTNQGQQNFTNETLDKT
jgi:hypothetical protein